MIALPIGQRICTGPLRIGADWPGIFIRGDEALGLADKLEALDRLSAPTRRCLIDELIFLLRQCDVAAK